jgi:hypothetical protein
MFHSGGLFASGGRSNVVEYDCLCDDANEFLRTAPMHKLDTTMSRTAHKTTYDAPSRSKAFRDQFSATPDTTDADDEAARLQLAQWREQVRRSFERPHASWATHWISRSLFVLGLLATGTVTFYVFSGESGERLTGSRLITRQQSPVGTVAPARLVLTRQSGTVDDSLPLGILTLGGSGEETVILKGFAEGTELSLGTSMGDSGWILLARDLERTIVEAPAQFTGVMRVTATAHSTDGLVLDQGAQELEWIAHAPQPAIGPSEASTPAPAPAPAPAPQETNSPALQIETSVAIPPQIETEEVDTLTARGQELLRHGDIAAARLLLKRAARAGNSLAALELGTSFDPKFLHQLGVLGLTPEVALARHWYEEASRLGSREAQQHLDQLARTHPK